MGATWNFVKKYWLKIAAPVPVAHLHFLVPIGALSNTLSNCIITNQTWISIKMKIYSFVGDFFSYHNNQVILRDVSVETK